MNAKGVVIECLQGRRRLISISIVLLICLTTISAQRNTKRTYTQEDGLLTTEVYTAFIAPNGNLVVQQNNYELFSFDGYSFELLDTISNYEPRFLSGRFENENYVFYFKDESSKGLVIDSQSIFSIDYSEYDWPTSHFVLWLEDSIFYKYNLDNKELISINLRDRKVGRSRTEFPYLVDSMDFESIGMHKLKKTNSTYFFDNYSSRFYYDGKLLRKTKALSNFRSIAGGTIDFEKEQLFLDNEWNHIKDLRRDEGIVYGGYVGDNQFIIEPLQEGAIFYSIDTQSMSLVKAFVVDHVPGMRYELTEHFIILTSHSGMHRYHKHITFIKSALNGMPSSLHVINEDKNGDIWFGSYGSGLSGWDGKEFYSPNVPFRVRKMLPGTMKDRKGNLYFIKEGRKPSSLIKVDSDTTAIFTPILSDPENLTGYFLDTLGNGLAIIGTNKIGLGIAATLGQFDFRFISHDKGMNLDNVLTAHEDARNRIWCGRSSQGIAVYDLPADTAVTWLNDKEDPTNFGVGSMEIDDRGTFWMGASGLYYLKDAAEFDIHNENIFEKAIHIQLPNGDNSNITFIKQIEDYIFFGNASSVNFLPLNEFYENPENPIIYQLIYGEDIEGGGSEQNCVLFDSKRRLWFGSHDGASYIDWDNFKFDTTTNYVELKSITAGNDTLERSTDGQIVLPKDNRNCEIRFGPERNPSLIKNIFFDYHLLNSRGDTLKSVMYDQNGIFRREAFDPGRYILLINAKKHGQLMHALETEIRVPRTLGENPWVWAIGVFLLTGTLIGFLILRNRQQKASYQLLQLQNDKDNLLVQSIISSFNPHFINNSLHWAQSRHRKDLVFVDMIDRLSENIQYIFTNSRNAQAFHTLKQEFKLVENYVEIQRVRFRDSFKFMWPPKGEIDKYENYEVIIMQLQIHVENAIEHGINNREASSFVSLKLVEADNGLYITIEDDGCGRAKAKELSSRGTQQGTKMLVELHSIFNKNNRREMFQMYEDDIFTDSTGVGYGTRVIIFIPKSYNTYKT